MNADSLTKEDQCAYCGRARDSQGAIFHASDCIGLEILNINRLEVDGYVKHIAALSQRCAELERENKILQLKANNSLANNLCPDHRDKQTGKSCLACEIERLSQRCAELEQQLQQNADVFRNAGMQVDADEAEEVLEKRAAAEPGAVRWYDFGFLNNGRCSWARHDNYAACCLPYGHEGEHQTSLTKPAAQEGSCYDNVFDNPDYK